MSKKALVTGASEGIGRSIAQKLAKQGYSVTAVARNEAKLKSVQQELGTGHDYLVADLSSDGGIEKVVKALKAGHYNVLVNNAGVGTSGDFTTVPIERQMTMFRLNCEAVVRLSYAFLESAKSGDALMNVSSTLAFLPSPGMGLYCATKSFVTALSESLWYEQQRKGVFVMGLHPGITTTNFQVAAGGKKEDLPKGLSQTPEQVADLAVKELLARAKPTVISGVKNALFAGMTRFMPRRSTVKMMGTMMPKSTN